MKWSVLSFALFCFMLSCTSKSKDADQGSDTTEQQVAGDRHNKEIDGDGGVVSISALIANREKYDGHTVTVKGMCVKVNNNIMNRNWVHLRDESIQDDTDLTVTTSENIKVDDIVMLQGKIALNKDFGAGYEYEIIMEDASVVK